MSYIAVLLFDADSEEKISRICRDICINDANTFMVDSCSRPHITLAMCNEFNEQVFYNQLDLFAVNREKFNLRLESIGIFPFKNSTLFLSPIITDALTSIHKDFYGVFTEDICPNQSTQYLPNRWVPHCTLAVGLPPDESIKAIQSLLNNFQPFDVRIEYIGIAEYSDGMEKPVIKTFDLGKHSQ